MTKKFIIHYCPGAGGMFLSSVFAKIMNIPLETKISSIGDCHDFGNGIWKDSQNVVMSHVFDIATGKMKLQHRPNKHLYYTHAVTNEFIEQNSDIAAIQISATPDDYGIIALMAVKKAWINLWTEEEYNKWVGPDYPPYSPKNIAESNLICRDVIEHALIPQTLDWYNEYADIKYSHQIDFKTVIGLNNKDLAQEVASIVGGNITDDACKFINEYQQLNKKLYVDWNFIPKS